MPISPARRLAYRILLRVESSRSLAVDLLQRSDVSAMKEVDRRLATELVMGVLRWRGELDYQIERLSGKSVERFDTEVLTVLRLSVYQIRFLERVPKRAVVDDAVELVKAARKRSAAGLVNAVLRKCEPPEERALGRDFEYLSVEGLARVRRAFPEWLLKRWEGTTATTLSPGRMGAMRLAYACLATPPTTLRLVQAGENLQAVCRELKAEGVLASPCDYAQERGIRVESGQVLNTRAYREGRVVIQDEASQLVAELVAPKRSQRVLDLCAAPGIKTGQLAQSLRAGTLVACDRSAKRLRTMAKLLPKWVPEAVRLSIVRLDAARELPFGAKFDRILLDAPCSGTGTLARNPEIKWRLTPEDITRLADLQTTMLRHALEALERDGRLVYATCSLEPEENEGVVEKVLSGTRGFRIVSSRELAQEHPHMIPLIDAQGFLRTRPDQHGMDGFNAVWLARYS